MTTRDQLREGLDMLVDGALDHDMHPIAVKEELLLQLAKVDELLKQIEDSQGG